MADVHDKKTRSFNMSQIKAGNTKPELLVRKYLHSKGFRFRLHNTKITGKPDLYLKKYNTVIFVNGCFWHSHQGCKYATVPKTRTDWWIDKLNRTKERDQEVKTELEKMGFNVLIIWECSLKKDKIEETLKDLYNHLRSRN